jgi:DNA-nicking Smr family endonuclease
MKRPLRAEDKRLWALVAATVRPAPGRVHPELPEATPDPARTAAAPGAPAAIPTPPTHQTSKTPPRRTPPPAAIEPLRKRRLIRERDAIEARIDLHGLDQDRARIALHDFLRRSHAKGFRAVLVITGKGTLGDGVLRRRAPDWLSEAEVRPFIAGVSQAARHHGGEGALYVALKRPQA